MASNHKEGLSETQQQIIKTCDDLKEFLLEKNRSYGDSALNPVRIFSRASPIEQIKVRLDDKISRLGCGKEYPGDDTIKDLAGYLVLFMIAIQENS